MEFCYHAIVVFKFEQNGKLYGKKLLEGFFFCLDTKHLFKKTFKLKKKLKKHRDQLDNLCLKY